MSSWYAAAPLLFGAQTADAAGGGLGWYFLLPALLAVLIVPFILGGLLGKKLRMPDHGWKIGLVLCTLGAAGLIVGTRWPPRLGIDLSGGSILVYEIEKQEGENVNMDQLMAALSLRVNPGGVREVTIRPYGANQVEIIIPEADQSELERIKNIITRMGALEFRILANQRDNSKIIARAKASDATRLYDAAGDLEAWWVPVKNDKVQDFNADYVRTSEVAVRTRQEGNQKVLEMLVVKDPQDVTGEYLKSSSPGVDQHGRPCVEFTFDSRGAYLFSQLTGRNLPDETQGFTRKLGIILDGQLYSAPAIQSTIYNRGEITGSFTKEEVDDLVQVLNAGSLPAALQKEPISELLVGPTLGMDTIRRGAWSIGISMALVLLFMAVYYRFAGLVACFALLANLLLILAVMITVKAAFTLPGLAGLVLTVGMAVDANVLIYERMREERDRGAALRMAIRNGFSRATTTIVDANLTTLITGIILYWIGTDQVKGFAVTLILGVTLSMYTAIFCSRVIFDIAEKRKWLTELKMMRLVGATNINFLGVRAACVIGSLVLIGAGMAGVWFRGGGILDIDFTGGVSVEVVFNQPKTTAEVRQKLSNELPDLAVTNVPLLEEAGSTKTGGAEYYRFVINTSYSQTERGPSGQVVRTPIDLVEQIIEKQFPDQLATNVMTTSGLKEVPQEPSLTGPAKRGPPSGTPAAQEPPALPAATDQGRRDDLPPDTLLASAAPGPALPAAEQAGAEPEAKTPAKPSAGADAPAEAKMPGEKTPAEAKMPAESSPAAGAGTEATATSEAPAKAGTGTEAKTPLATPPETGTAPKTGAGQESSEPQTTPPGVENLKSLPQPYAGGTEAKLNFSERISHDTLAAMINERLGGKQEVSFTLTNASYYPGNNTPYNDWNLKIKLPPKETRSLLDSIAANLQKEPYFPSSNTIGGAVAGKTRQAAIMALIFSLVCIVAYIWVRFQRVVFGLAAVIALVHDVLITLGVIALSAYLAMIPGVQQFLLVDEFKIGLSVLAAFLTIIGYSLNDTIIVFDRIREVRGKSPRLTEEMINASVNQTLSRTLLTSGTTLLVIVTLYIGGGQAIHAFAFALLVGVIVGTYSSIYIASPILLWMTRPQSR